MNKYFKNIQVLSLMTLLLLTLFACRKKHPYFFPDGTPGGGADSSHITVDTSMSNIDYSKYPQARVFPGLVGNDVPRIVDSAVTLDLNYSYVEKTLRISVAPQPLFSMGLYAPPGELIEIDVPEGLHKLSVQIGGWTDNLGGKLNPKRDPLIYSRQKLSPGKNYVRNLYGGTIYIKAARPVENPVTLHVSGAVKEPDFVLGETDPQEWWENLQKYDVPWLELRSPNFIALVPRKKFLIEGLDDPSKALDFWNQVVLHDYYGWMGLERNPSNPKDQAPFLPFRAVLDIDISVGYGHNGYPVMWVDDMYWFNSVANYDAIKRLDAWGSFHEFGHNCQQGSTWSLSNLGETTNNLFIYHAAQRMNKQFKQEGIDTVSYTSLHNTTESWAKGLEYAEKDEGKSFVTDIGDPFEAILPFMQIFMKAKPYAGSQWSSGWDFMTVLYRKARRVKHLSTNDQDRRDFIYEALCNFTHKDWLPWFIHWGMRVSSVSKADIQEKGYLFIDKNYWTYNPTTDTGGTGSINFDPYDKGNWNVIDFSAQQKYDGTAPNGLASSIVDGDIDTYWHSEYSPDNPLPPHFITVDMGSELAIKGFKIWQRQGGGTSRHLKKIGIKISVDGDTWTDLGTYPLLDNDNEQDINFGSTKNFRYFKVYMTDDSFIYNAGNFYCLGEVSVIKP